MPLQLTVTLPPRLIVAGVTEIDGPAGCVSLSTICNVALLGLPGLNRFVYRNYLSRAPFIRGWLTKFALGDPSRMNEEMVRALATCAQQAGAEHAIFGFLRGQLAFDIESRLDGVPHPASVLWPDRASGFPRSAGEEISRKLKRASTKASPGRRCESRPRPS